MQGIFVGLDNLECFYFLHLDLSSTFLGNIPSIYLLKTIFVFYCQIKDLMLHLPSGAREDKERKTELTKLPSLGEGCETKDSDRVRKAGAG